MRDIGLGLIKSYTNCSLCRIFFDGANHDVSTVTDKTYQRGKQHKINVNQTNKIRTSWIFKHDHSSTTSRHKPHLFHKTPTVSSAFKVQYNGIIGSVVRKTADKNACTDEYLLDGNHCRIQASFFAFGLDFAEI